MSSPSTGTKELLLSLITDIEVLSKEVFEEATNAQANRFAARGDKTRITQVLDALVAQDKRLKETLSAAKEQAVVQVRIDQLNSELDRRNSQILALQKNLKEAETSLASAVFEAKKKLSSIKKAEDNAVTVDELIRFAHRISASGAVAAPPTWAPGDPSRRPYPTDAEMRQGLLAKNFEKLKESYVNQNTQTVSQASLSSSLQNDSISQSFPLSGYNWSSTSSTTDTNSFMTSSISHQMNMKQSNDVEIMSQSDTSSSSSSDEQ